MSSPSLVFILAEDQRQKQFIHRFLTTSGLNSHQMTIEVSPSGQGSAEQWVRKNFARQARKCRARNTRASTGMFVLLDADSGSVQEHLRELDAALIAEDQPKFNSMTDKIARLIPKWSIETWILFLISNGEHTPPLGEGEPYKNSKTAEEWSELIPEASEIFFAWTKAVAKIPNNLLDSLRLALQEIPRVLPVGK
jgi:hypothetical protein